MRKTSRILALAVLAAAVAAGCGDSTATVDQAEVESQARAELTKSVGQQAPPVKCPGDLDSEVGAKMTCSISGEGLTYDVAIEVTKVKEHKATFDVKVADKPR